MKLRNICLYAGVLMASSVASAVELVLTNNNNHQIKADVNTSYPADTDWGSAKTRWSLNNFTGKKVEFYWAGSYAPCVILAEQSDMTGSKRFISDNNYNYNQKVGSFIFTEMDDPKRITLQHGAVGKSACSPSNTPRLIEHGDSSGEVFYAPRNTHLALPASHNDKASLLVIPALVLGEGANQDRYEITLYTESNFTGSETSFYSNEKEQVIKLWEHGLNDNVSSIKVEIVNVDTNLFDPF